MAIDWTTLLSVDLSATSSLVKLQHQSNDPKLSIRGYSLPFQGTQQRFSDLITSLRRQLLKYVFPEKERPADIDWALARNRFGSSDPSSDGKLGEVLLYLFVETYLGTPLMAYKLKDLSNPNLQVNGADGVFVGEYRGQAALLVGESKIHQSLASAISGTIDSLSRFHNAEAALDHELLIAKKYPPQRDLPPEMLQEVMDILDRRTGALVHPVFISYDWSTISKVSSECTAAEEAEAQLLTHFVEEAKNWSARIASLRSGHPKPFEVFLDFFFLPVADCLLLRHAFYEMLHGHPYRRPTT